MDTAEFADAEAITVFLQKIVLCKGQTRGYFRNFCIFTAEIFCVIESARDGSIGGFMQRYKIFMILPSNYLAIF